MDFREDEIRHQEAKSHAESDDRLYIKATIRTVCDICI